MAAFKGCQKSSGNFFFLRMQKKQMDCPSSSEVLLLCSLKPRRGGKKKKSAKELQKPPTKHQKRIEVRTLADQAGMTGAQIVRKTGYSKSFVYREIEKSKAHEPIEDKPRTGRPKKRTKAVEKKILKLTKGKEKRSTRKVAKLLESEGVKLSAESVRLALRDNGLIPHRQVPRPKLTEDHQKRRLEFAREFLNHDWRHTLFTDEKHFTTFSPPNRRNDVIWDERGIEFVFEKVKHPPQIRFWGGISYFGKTALVEYEGTINSERYIDIIKNQQASIYSMFGRTPFWFQQDGATAHTSSASQNFLRQTFAHFLEKGQWPANSPDLNVIENLWSIINDRVWARDPKGVNEMRTIILEEWNSLEPEILENLVDSMTHRLQECIDRNGTWTSY
jgi:transposase